MPSHLYFGILVCIHEPGIDNLLEVCLWYPPYHPFPQRISNLDQQLLTESFWSKSGCGS